jgi:hypothetical protein
MAELNAFHGKLRGLIEANQAVENEVKRIADAEGARTLDPDTIINLALLFFDAQVALLSKCRDGDNGTEPEHGDLHDLGKGAAEFLHLSKFDVNELLTQLCKLLKDISDDPPILSLFPPAPKKKRPRAP